MRGQMSESGKMILLVEDNEDNRIVYSTILKHFGYEVTEAWNGEEGIAKARAARPDLILMDISIPIIDGWEATQVLKHDPDTRHIPCPGIRQGESVRGWLRRLPRQAVRAASSRR
jgi:CheY-like chemotaxis protein